MSAVLPLEFASHLVARALPPLCSVNSVDSVNSKTMGIANRIIKHMDYSTLVHKELDTTKRLPLSLLQQHLLLQFSKMLFPFSSCGILADPSPDGPPPASRADSQFSSFLSVLYYLLIINHPNGNISQNSVLELISFSFYIFLYHL